MKLGADRARRQNAPNKLFAVQDPDCTLRFSEWEVDGCARHFARDCLFIKKGEEATVDAVKRFAGEATELLFSCHGRFETEKPRDSALILYGTERLRIAEILALRLSEVDLVVASACETGVSDIRDVADEYVGLPGAFVAAGVRTVVSSLWAVSDLATALLIERFHENLYRHGRTPSEALRSAQRWLRDVELQELLGRLKEKQDALTAMNWNGIEDDLDALANRISVADVGMARTTVRRLGLRPFSNPVFWAAFQIVGAGW